MVQKRAVVFLSAGILLIAGCGGGGSSSSPSASSLVPPVIPTSAPATATRMMDLSFSGTTTLGRARSAKSLAGTPVTATYNGKTVATGTLDANGHALLTFTAEVPRGATIIVTAGSVTATIVLAHSDDGTAAQVQVNANGTLTVSTAPEHPGASPAASPSPGASPSPSPTPGGDDTTTEQEDSKGNPIVISTTMDVLPANLPITIVAACGVITIAPVAGTLPHVEIEMKAKDGDSDARFKFEGALTAPVSFPIPAGALRLRIRIFGPAGETQLDIASPVNASTSTTGASPCPSSAPTAAPSPSASASASPAPHESESASPAPSASGSASPSPHASEPPSPVPSASASAAPSPSPSASAAPSPTASASGSPGVSPSPGASVTPSPSPSPHV